MVTEGRVAKLRSEIRGPDTRSLWARLNEHGDLLIEGQDLGPGTAPVSTDGEYEWVLIFRSKDVPQLRTLLEMPDDADLLTALEQSWSGDRSYELERRIRESDVPHETSTWKG